MPDLIICDTSCLILFHKLNKLSLLNKLYNYIYITPVIEKEFGLDLPDWVNISQPSNIPLIQTLSQIIDEGEASAIALSFEVPGSLLVLDDLKARSVAKSLNLKITGSLGILIKLKQQGYIQLLKPILEEVQLTDFRISDNIIKKILSIAGE